MGNQSNVDPNGKIGKKDVKHWLAVGGILCAIASVSAAILTSLNLWTSPIIEANKSGKKLEGFKKIFSDLKGVSEYEKVEEASFPSIKGRYTAYKDTGKSDVLGYIYDSAVIPVKSYGNIHALVGLSGSADDPILGKVYLVEDSLSYKQLFEEKYVEPYNKNPSEANLNNVKCGATFGAEALKAIVVEARDHFMSTGDPFVEDLDADILAIYGEGSQYSKDRMQSSLVSGGTYVKKSYSFFEDEGDSDLGEIGRLYSSKYKSEKGDIYITVGISGSSEAPKLGKLVVTKNSFADVTSVKAYVDAYNASPSKASLEDTNGNAQAEIIKNIVNETESVYKKSGGLRLTSSVFASDLKLTFASVGESTSLSASSSMVNVLRYWSVYSDEAKTNETAKVYKVRSKMEAIDGNEFHSFSIESDTTFLVAISGPKDDPILGRLRILSNVSGGQSEEALKGYVNVFPGEGGNMNKDNITETATGGTYTIKAVWEGIDKAVALYKE